jgi:hypothetical protein
MAITHTTAYVYACAAGHARPDGEALQMIVPGGLDLTPACTACQQPMAPAGEPLNGAWRADECCTPAGPGGRWAGPPRDPRACTSCFGTRQHALCLACYTVNCDGRHGDQCLACDADGTADCPACDGDGHVYNQFGEDEGLCPDPRCTAGRVPCPACGGTRKAPGSRRLVPGGTRLVPGGGRAGHT